MYVKRFSIASSGQKSPVLITCDFQLFNLLTNNMKKYSEILPCNNWVSKCGKTTEKVRKWLGLVLSVVNNNCLADKKQSKKKLVKMKGGWT